MTLAKKAISSESKLFVQNRSTNVHSMETWQKRKAFLQNTSQWLLLLASSGLFFREPIFKITSRWLMLNINLVYILYKCRMKQTKAETEQIFGFRYLLGVIRLFIKEHSIALYRSSRPELFCKKLFLEISQNSQENTCARASFLIG